MNIRQVVIDLRTALEELHAYDKSPPSSSTEHIFLILDKTVQSFPWESIPTLQQKSISRIPSIAFLRDRIDLAAFTSAEKKEKGEMVIDSRKTSFVINAEGDLKKTELAFTPWLERMKAVGWTGITGRAPMEEEVKSALVNKDLFLFVFRPCDSRVRSDEVSQVFRTWRSGAVHPFADTSATTSLRDDDALGLFVRSSERFGRFRSDWNALSLHGRWLVSPSLCTIRNDADMRGAVLRWLRIYGT